MVEYQITTVNNSFKVEQILDGVTVYQSTAFTKGGAELKLVDGNIKLIASGGIYSIPFDFLAVPANNGTAQDIYSKLTKIMF